MTQPRDPKLQAYIRALNLEYLLPAHDLRNTQLLRFPRDAWVLHSLVTRGQVRLHDSTGDAKKELMKKDNKKCDLITTYRERQNLRMHIFRAQSILDIPTNKTETHV